MMILGLG